MDYPFTSDLLNHSKSSKRIDINAYKQLDYNYDYKCANVGLIGYQSNTPLNVSNNDWFVEFEFNGISNLAPDWNNFFSFGIHISLCGTDNAIDPMVNWDFVPSVIRNDGNWHHITMGYRLKDKYLYRKVDNNLYEEKNYNMKEQNSFYFFGGGYRNILYSKVRNLKFCIGNYQDKFDSVLASKLKIK